MRIVHCVRSPIGGIFRHIVDLALAQTAMGHDVGIVCDADTGGVFEANLIAEVAPKLTLGISRFSMRRQISLTDLAASWKLFAHLRSLKPDVLHGHGAKGGAFSRLSGTLLGMLGRKTPVRIYCAHGGSLHFDPATREGELYFRLERFMERMTDGIVFVSDYEERCYNSKIHTPKKPFRRVYNGLKPEEFEPIVPNDTMADLMYAGMMRDLKGPQILIDSLVILEKKHGLKPTLRMMGEGDDRPAYMEKVVALGMSDRVSFHTPMPTRQALSQARVLVVPSLAESMPYIVLETVAARIPLIATAVGGIPEIFGKRSDRLVPPGNAEALADSIAMTLNNEDAARADAMKFGSEIAGRFSVSFMAEEIVDFYEDLANPQRVIEARKRNGPLTLPHLRPDSHR